jgi:hypothetical protein
MVHHLSEEPAQLKRMQETIDTHPVPPLLIPTHIHIHLLILMFSHATNLLEEQA